MKQQHKLVIKQKLDHGTPYLWKGWYKDTLMFKYYCYKTVVVNLNE